MELQDYSFIFLFIGAIACTIGAVPLGLVNLSVINETVNKGIKKATSIALGASFIEILFALTALFSGTILEKYLINNKLSKVVILSILLAAGIFFIFKKNRTNYSDKKRNTIGFIKGAFLNLASLQVLIFWIFTIIFLSVRNILPESTFQILFFVFGVWLAKMAVLHFYAVLAKRVVARSQIFSQNINLIIGVMIIVIALIQFIKL